MRATRPRLAANLYRGLQRVFLAFCTANREAFFANADVVSLANEQILHAATEFHVAVVAYCFMPNHVHLLVEGERDDADALRFVHRAKQRSAFAFSQRIHKKLWQPSFHDHILRDDEASISVARYVVENPVRARLVVSPRDFAFLGSTKYSLDEILEAVTWQP